MMATQILIVSNELLLRLIIFESKAWKRSRRTINKERTPGFRSLAMLHPRFFGVSVFPTASEGLKWSIVRHLGRNKDLLSSGD